MSKPSLKLCPDPELQDFVRRLVTAIGVVLRETRLPGNPTIHNKRVDLIPNSTPRRKAGRDTGLAYGNLERIESGAIQPRFRTLQLVAAGVGSSLPALLARAWWRTVTPECEFMSELAQAESIVNRLELDTTDQLPTMLGKALAVLRGSVDPAAVADRAQVSRGYYLQLERGERNGSVWAFTAVCHSLSTSLPALLYVAWTHDQPLGPEEEKAIAAVRRVLSERKWRPTS